MDKLYVRIVNQSSKHVFHGDDGGTGFVRLDGGGKDGGAYNDVCQLFCIEAAWNGFRIVNHDSGMYLHANFDQGQDYLRLRLEPKENQECQEFQIEGDIESTFRLTHSGLYIHGDDSGTGFLRLESRYNDVCQRFGIENHSDYARWLPTVDEKKFAHQVVHGKLIRAPNFPDDRSEGGYNTNRNNITGWTGRLGADILSWKLGLRTNFFSEGLTGLPKPEMAKPDLYLDDNVFADFQLAGPDPMKIEMVKRNQPDSIVSRHHDGLVKFIGADLDKDLDAGKIFQVDFTKYKDVQTTGRPAAWPAALFTTKGDGLRPVAIEAPGFNSPLVFAPEFDRSVKGADWVRAKRLHQVAAANYHELGTHLGRCHLVMQPYALATYRKLPKFHPIGMLLRPHFKFMTATNNQAFDELINTGGPIDRSFMAKRDELLKITDNSVKTWDLRKHGSIEEDLKSRGFPKDSSPVYFSYHHYGIQVYHKIKDFVNNYVTQFAYPKPDDLEIDIGIWTWNESLSKDYGLDPNSLPIRGNPQSIGMLQARNDLVEALTNIIWTCGPQHSVVNYLQYPYFEDANTLPFATYPNTGATGAPFAIPRDRIEDQGEVIARLSDFRFDKLGFYASGSGMSEYGNLGQAGQGWSGIVASFQHALVELGHSFDQDKDRWQSQRNAKLPTYDVLKPENITNAISI